MAGPFYEPRSRRIDSIFHDVFAAYRLSDLESGETAYNGYVDPEGRWYITKVTATAIRYAWGESGYEDAWTGKADLTYDYFYKLF